jgi:hypothetical protein
MLTPIDLSELMNADLTNLKQFSISMDCNIKKKIG